VVALTAWSMHRKRGAFQSAERQGIQRA